MTDQSASVLESRARAYRDASHPLWRRILVSRESAIIAVLIIVLIVASLSVRNFASPITSTYLLLDMAPVMLVALPMTLIIVSGEIDLSVASVVGLSSVLLGALTQAGWPVELAALVSIFVGAVGGFVNGILVTVVGLPSLAVTIGTLALYRGLAVGVLGTAAVTDFPEFWTTLAKDKITGTPIPVITILVLILAIVFILLLHFTPFGRGIFAIGLSSDAAAFSGVKVGRTKLILFVLSGVVSAIVGIYYTFRYGSARGDNAEGLELSVIAAVLLGGVSIFGGRGAIHGVIAGALLIGVLASALRLAGITSDVISIITGTLLVLSVVLTSFLTWLQRARQGAAKRRRDAAQPITG